MKHCSPLQAIFHQVNRLIKGPAPCTTDLLYDTNDSYPLYHATLTLHINTLICDVKKKSKNESKSFERKIKSYKCPKLCGL